MPNRVFCDKHDPRHEAKWKDGCRPLLDDTCYMCKTDRLTSLLAEKDQHLLEENLQVKRLESQLAERDVEVEKLQKQQNFIVELIGEATKWPKCNIIRCL